MKEILELHQKILALPENARPEDGVNFSRAEEENDGVEELPSGLQDEIAALRSAINATLPEDFDYFAFVYQEDEEPSFSLQFEQMPTGESGDVSDFQTDRFLVEQLRESNWEELRTNARKHRETMDGVEHLIRLMSESLRSAKVLQRDYREETRDFVREKRKDEGQIHVMYWDDDEGLMEAAFADGDKLRDALPSMIAQGSEVFAVVAWGKPLPVERIDALNLQAQKALRDRISASIDEAVAEEEAAKPSALPAGSGVDEQVDAVGQEVGHLPDDVSAQQVDQPQAAGRAEQQA